jgi:hypothetical protein
LFQAKVHDCQLAWASERERWASPWGLQVAQGSPQRVAWRQLGHRHSDPTVLEQVLSQKESGAALKGQRAGWVS